MSYYSIDTKKIPLLFIHIPKTAGTSVREWMYNFYGMNKIIGFKHAPISYPHLKDLKITSFAIIRNPFERAVSLYQEFGDIAANNFGKDLFGVDNLTVENWNKGFDYFVQNFFNSIVVQENISISPAFTQHSYISINNKIKVDHILKFETLDRDFKNIQSIVGNYENLGKHQVGKFIHLKNYKDLYTNSSKQLIEEIYKEDLEKFNYVF